MTKTCNQIYEIANAVVHSMHAYCESEKKCVLMSVLKSNSRLIDRCISYWTLKQ